MRCVSTSPVCSRIGLQLAPVAPGKATRLRTRRPRGSRSINLDKSSRQPYSPDSHGWTRRWELEILRRVRSLWKHGSVFLTIHGEERLEQSGLLDDDIWNVLKHGRIVRVDSPIELIRYSIRGKASNGSVLVCAVEMDEEAGDLTIVTVYEDVVE